MKPVIRFLAIAAVAALAVPSMLAHAQAPVLGSGPVAFTNEVRVGPNVGEPGVRVAQDGTIWVHYPGGLFKSTNGGASFGAAGLSPVVIFGGDADLTIMKDGSLLYADLGLSISVSKSTSPSGGFPWIENPVAADLVGVDRQWIDSGPDPITGLDVAYLVYNSFQVPIGLRVLKSNTGGVVFEETPVNPPSFGFTCFRGNVAVSQADGAVYVADCTGSGPRVWRSLTGGATWGAVNVNFRTTGYNGFLFPIVATDLGGNVYMTWTEKEAGQTNVYIAGSTNQGLTWGPRVKLTSATSAGIMAWPEGGRAGTVGVAWYAMDRQGDADAPPTGSAWHVEYATIQDYFGARTITQGPVTTDTVQIGKICGQGTGCSGGRNLLDFMMIRTDPQGRANVVWTDGCDPCTDAGGSTASHIKFARQTGGPLLR